MIDSNFQIFLIEVNTNPCLDIFSKITEKIIPNLIDNIFLLTIDPLFPPQNTSNSRNNKFIEAFPELNFELIYETKVPESI